MSTQCQINSTSGFIRSGGQARLMSFGDCNFVMILSAVSLCGFGTHKSTSTYSSKKYNDTWPKVFSKQVETYSRISDGATSTVTTVCAINNNNPYKVVTGSTLNIGTPVSTVVTDTLMTVNLTDGTYTAQLTGNFDDNSSAAPYDPLNTTNGWQILTNTAKLLLDQYSFQTINDGYKLKYVGTAASVVYEYNLIITPLNSPTMGFVPAAAHGFPTRIPEFNMSQDLNYPMGHFYSNFLTISEDAGHWGTLPDADIKCGACVCAKSSWILTGSPPLSGGSYPQSNNHKTIYSEELILDGSGDFSLGSIVNATFVGANPITPPSAIDLLPEQILLQGYSFGLLGFRSANA